MSSFLLPRETEVVKVLFEYAFKFKDEFTMEFSKDYVRVAGQSSGVVAYVQAKVEGVTVRQETE